jgi:thiamine biosynthesis protein ThiS
MRVEINGNLLLLPDSATVAAMLAELVLDPRHVAVERNRTIVPRSTFAHTTLAEGDRIEIVHFVGGG